MRKWAEALQETTTDLGPAWEKVAALDITSEADGGESVMAELKTAYGPDAVYQYHACYHDDGGPCHVSTA